MPAQANTGQNIYTLPLPRVGRVLVYLLAAFLPSPPSSQLWFMNVCKVCMMFPLKTDRLITSVKIGCSNNTRSLTINLLSGPKPALPTSHAHHCLSTTVSQFAFFFSPTYHCTQLQPMLKAWLTGKQDDKRVKKVLIWGPHSLRQFFTKTEFKENSDSYNRHGRQSVFS